MILILGGTTEGRAAAAVLEEAGALFYYSTRGDEQEVTLHSGRRVHGALDAGGLETFVREHDIRLLVDAAHPFAAALHANAAQAAARLGLPVIRYERIYPPRAGDITWCEGYEDAVRRIRTEGLRSVLVLTGVQSIARLQALWQGNPLCRVRILDRDSSRRVAQAQGFPEAQLCYYRSGEDETHLLEQLRPQAILLKESGISGGFPEKTEAARRLGIRIFALSRPVLPQATLTVDGRHGLRRAVERLLPEFFPLRSGLTTGTCAAAAAVAALWSLLDAKGGCPPAVPVILPDAETLHVAASLLTGMNNDEETSASESPRTVARAAVVKDAGDDPDITNGLSICAEVRLDSAHDRAPLPSDDETPRIEIRGGEGVGTVTLPGLGIAVGDAAINAGPRRMIRHNLLHTLERFGRASDPALHLTVTISVPGGTDIGRRTFNPRLGIEGGISIIGTSGIVRPFSSEAFVSSIRKSMEVALATGSERVVISSGAKSERFIRARYPELPAQAFVHYGNFIGETLELAAKVGVRQVTLGIMMGKAVKLAEGHLDTHSKHTVLNRAFIADLARQAGCTGETLTAIAGITLARELWSLLPTDRVKAFCQVVLAHCHRHCDPLLPDGTLTLLLIDEEGGIYGQEAGRKPERKNQ